ncbi:substrate-binding domain-containing protein [Roseomonas sp. WA12]
MRGGAEIGFQLVSEIVAVPCSTYLDMIPEGVQRPTIFYAVIAANARQPEGSAARIQFLASTDAAPAIPRTGLEPSTR